MNAQGRHPLDPEWDDDTIYLEGEPGPCIQCSTPTHFAELNFQCHVCSAACLDSLVKDWVTASKRR